MKNFFDYRLSKILSTFDFPRARVEAWSAKNPEVLMASGFFFDIVGRQMSFFAISWVVSPFRPVEKSRWRVDVTHSHIVGAVWPRHGVFSAI